LDAENADDADDADKSRRATTILLEKIVVALLLLQRILRLSAFSASNVDHSDMVAYAPQRSVTSD
jgi:hypothetical protein